MMNDHGMNTDHAAGMEMHGHGGMGGMAAMAEMMRQLPRGISSPSGHYWCSTCKKMFDIDEPVCPYMPKMCVNTPVPIETVPPGSAAFYERAGLFYPKLLQRVLAAAVRQAAEPALLGEAFADDFLADAAEWNVQYQASPIETVKAFLIYTAGFDVATRSSGSGLTFYLMDAEALWGEEIPAKVRSRTALLAGAQRVAQALDMRIPLDLHFMTVMPGKMGRYFCGGCNMFFEFGQPRAEVTCPFMSQKCIFRPKPVAEMAEMPEAPEARSGRQFDVDLLTKIFAVSPKLYRRQIESALEHGLDPAVAREVLTHDMRSWGFRVTDDEALAILWRQLGIAVSP